MDFLKRFSPHVHWLPRLALFGIFGYHGIPKLTQTAMVSEGIGLPVVVVFALGLAEVGGALLILWGGLGPEWATQVAGLIFAGVMVGAIATVHAQHGWNSIGAMGMEFQVLILATSLYLAVKGRQAR